MAEPGPEAQPGAQSSQRVMYKRQNRRLFNTEIPKTSPQKSTSKGWDVGEQGGQRRVFRLWSGTPPAGIPTSTGLSALRQGTDRPLGGFHGCIHEVRINNELQDFKALPPQALGVSPGCKSCSVCRHGLCRAVEKDSVVCECHPGWAGPLCDQEARDPCLGHRSVLHALPTPRHPCPSRK